MSDTTAVTHPDVRAASPGLRGRQTARTPRGHRPLAIVTRHTLLKVCDFGKSYASCKTISSCASTPWPARPRLLTRLRFAACGAGHGDQHAYGSRQSPCSGGAGHGHDHGGHRCGASPPHPHNRSGRGPNVSQICKVDGVLVLHCRAWDVGEVYLFYNVKRDYIMHQF